MRDVNTTNKKKEKTKGGQLFLFNVCHLFFFAHLGYDDSRICKGLILLPIQFYHHHPLLILNRTPWASLDYCRVRHWWYRRWQRLGDLPNPTIGGGDGGMALLDQIIELLVLIVIIGEAEYRDTRRGGTFLPTHGPSSFQWWC